MGDKGGLIQEIQRGAIDPDTSVATLLRKVHVSAVKLKLPSLESWVRHELEGYGTADVPAYRIIYGKPKIWNPYNGWMPLVTPNQKTYEAFARVEIRESIGSLEQTLSIAGEYIQISFTQEEIAWVNENSRVAFGRMEKHFSLSQGKSIVEAVRDRILNWALEMEASGVTGEGISFAADEQRKAANAMTTFNIGSIGSFAGNLGQGNTSGDIHQGLAFENIEAVLQQIEGQSSTLEADGIDLEVLRAQIADIREELTRSRSPGVVRALLQDLRNTISGGMGGIVTAGALQLISKLLG